VTQKVIRSKKAKIYCSVKVFLQSFFYQYFIETTTDIDMLLQV